MTKTYFVYFFSIGGLNSRLQSPLPATDGFKFQPDPWVFYLDQQRNKYPFRVFSVPFFRKLGRTGILMPFFPFQGQFFFSTPGRLRIRSVIWNRHPISKLLFRLVKVKLKNFFFLKNFPKLVRFFSHVSILQRLSWKNLFWAQLLTFIETHCLFPFQIQRKFDVLFHPWIFSSRRRGVYTVYEKKFLNWFFSRPPNLKQFSSTSTFRMPIRFRRRFYYSVWISPSFNWYGKVNNFLHRPFPQFSLLSPKHLLSSIWLKQRPGLP